jgi:hypothetical protein
MAGMQMMGGMMQGMMGGMMQAQGGRMQADAYRQHAAALMQAAQYNAQIVAYNRNLQLKHLAQAIPRTISTQTAQAANQGLSVASKSVRMIHNETMYVAGQKANEMRVAADLEIQKIYYDAQVQAMSLENQARAAEYSGRMGMMQSMMGSFNQMFRGLQGMGS